MKIKVLDKNCFVARNIMFSNEVKYFDKKYLNKIDQLNITPSNSELFSKIVNKLKKNLRSKSKIFIKNTNYIDQFSDIDHSLGIVDANIYLSNLCKAMIVNI